MGQECRGCRFNSYSQQIPHALEQLKAHVTQLPSPHSRARKPQLLSLRPATTEARERRALGGWESHCREKPGLHDDGQPRLRATGEGLCTAVKTHCTKTTEASERRALRGWESHCWEKPGLHDDRQPRLRATGEGLYTAVKTHCSKKKKINELTNY